MTSTPIEATPAALVSLMLSTPRLLVFMSVVPLFPPAIFPRTLRAGIAIGLGLPVAVGVFHQGGPQPLPPDFVAILLKECVLGLLLALPVAVPFWSLMSLGALIDNQRGANAAQQVTPFAMADSSVLGAGLLKALIVMLAASGAFALIYRLLLHSFEVWPVLTLVPDASQFGWELAVTRFDEFMLHTVLLAVPVIAVIMLVDFAFALLGVFAPSLQTYFASMPIKSLVAIGMLALYLAVLMSAGEDYFREMFRRESALLESRSP